MKLLLFCLLLGLLGSSAAVAQTTNSGDYNTLHEEMRLREQATDQARKLGRALHLTEAQLMQVRDFAFVQLRSLNDAEARFAGNPDERNNRTEAAAAIFQRQVANLLNDSQMETFMQLLARQARREQAKQAAKDAAKMPEQPVPTSTP